jgi:hypothetical protein
MSYKNAVEQRAYARNYHLARYYKIRRSWIVLLGTKCIVCAATDDLQIDHKIPSTKSFSISMLWGLPKEQLLIELAKCQLLCRTCHKKKTATEQTKGHGTWGMYRNRKCRCIECRAFVSAYMKRYGPERNKKRRAKRRAGLTGN